MERKIFFKAEANEKVGGGHLQRALALAKECNLVGMNASFVFADTKKEFIEDLIGEEFPIYNIELESQYNVDSYLNFIPQNALIVFDTDDPNYYSGKLIEDLLKNDIKSACYSISDSYKISTNILINPNIISQIQHFNTAPYTKQLLGPEYLIFRKEFRELAIPTRSYQNPPHLLLIFGNADVRHLTLYFLKILDRIKKNLKKVTIVAGDLNPDLPEIISRVEAMEDIEIELKTKLNKISAIYEVIDVAISSAGMAMWEMALFNIPQMIVASSDREIEYTNYLSQLDYIFNLSPIVEKSTDNEIASIIADKLLPEKLQEIKTKDFSEIIDPNGIKNTVDAFQGVL